MRRILLIISMVSAAFVGANAQPGNVRFGIKMGPTIDWASSGSTATTGWAATWDWSVTII